MQSPHKVVCHGHHRRKIGLGLSFKMPSCTVFAWFGVVFSKAFVFAACVTAIIIVRNGILSCNRCIRPFRRVDVLYCPCLIWCSFFLGLHFCCRHQGHHYRQEQYLVFLFFSCFRGGFSGAVFWWSSFDASENHHRPWLILFWCIGAAVLLCFLLFQTNISSHW